MTTLIEKLEALGHHWLSNDAWIRYTDVTALIRAHEAEQPTNHTTLEEAMQAAHADIRKTTDITDVTDVKRVRNGEQVTTPYANHRTREEVLATLADISPLGTAVQFRNKAREKIRALYAKGNGDV